MVLKNQSVQNEALSDPYISFFLYILSFPQLIINSHLDE